MEIDAESLQDALAFNAEQGLDAEQIELVQLVIGVDPMTGEMDELTVQWLWAWQGWMGLPQSGKLDEPSKRRIQRLASVGGSLLPEMVRVGCWVDSPPAEVLREAALVALEAMGMETLAIELVGEAGSWVPRWTADQLARLAALCEPREIAVVLVVAVAPVRAAIEAALAELPALVEAGGAAGIELAIGEGWSEAELVGFASLDEAAAVLAAGMREICAASEMILELSVDVDHQENGEMASLAPQVDRVLPRAFSVRTRAGSEVGWEHANAPEHEQTRAAAVSERIPGVIDGVVALGMGLAADDQRWPDHEPEEALDLALDAAALLGIAEVRYRASSSLLAAQSPAAAFLQARPERVDEDDWEDELAAGGDGAGAAAVQGEAEVGVGGEGEDAGTGAEENVAAGGEDAAGELAAREVEEIPGGEETGADAGATTQMEPAREKAASKLRPRPARTRPSRLLVEPTKVRVRPSRPPRAGLSPKQDAPTKLGPAQAGAKPASAPAPERAGRESLRVRPSRAARRVVAKAAGGQASELRAKVSVKARVRSIRPRKKPR
ncbi:hypothetical protein G6O69_34540 [Pseudenhygromyxa sp. WMMC2535]|uniref:hypothetical protein n=1 Tax=Pseudenhygromyxa sp. WMMC2535 TaxID=2712867 RepID=UPI001556BB92|nr:hypothetical protein [Pseudenhygromyxa sp. WMMC2535]NVB42992.1 hypothetical protein [Pseudenhygromyxa sp. WMMC2535]